MEFMKVEKIMKTDVGVCRADDELATVVRIMRRKDCGVVPVVDEANQLAGMITDRDICFAAGNKKLSAVKVADIIGDRIAACAPGDKIEGALKKMGKYQLKRLPVVGKQSEIVGIISISDIVLAVKKDKKLKKKIYETIEEIYAPRPIVLREINASTETKKASD